MYKLHTALSCSSAIWLKGSKPDANCERGSVPSRAELNGWKDVRGSEITFLGVPERDDEALLALLPPNLLFIFPSWTYNIPKITINYLKNYQQSYNKF